PDSARVFLQITSAGQLQGTQQVPLQREPGSQVRYSAQGTELSVVGNWNLELIVRRPNLADWSVTSQLSVSKTPQVERAPGLPLRFLGYAPVLALLVAALGLVVLVAGSRRKRNEDATERR